MMRAIVGQNALLLPPGFDERARIAVDERGNVVVCQVDQPPQFWRYDTGEWEAIALSDAALAVPREFAPVRLWGYWGAGA